nr:hypothetical protein Iba_chr07cCG3310 [Ipomoea batatas]
MSDVNLLLHSCFTESETNVSPMKGFHSSPLGLARTQLTFDGGLRTESSLDVFLFCEAEFWGTGSRKQYASDKEICSLNSVKCLSTSALDRNFLPVPGKNNRRIKEEGINHLGTLSILEPSERGTSSTPQPGGRLKRWPPEKGVTGDCVTSASSRQLESSSPVSIEAEGLREEEFRFPMASNQQRSVV